MGYMKINDEEQSALDGLPYLQQLLYLRGIRPYVDYKTYIPHQKIKITFLNISEAVF